jgi:hypothetical protein
MQIALAVSGSLYASQQNWPEAPVYFAAALVTFSLLPLVGILRTKVDIEAAVSFCDSASQFGVLLAAMSLFAVLATLSGLESLLLSDGPAALLNLSMLLVGCGVAVTIPIVFCWRQAVEDQRFPVPGRKETAFDHIDTWAVILFAAAVGGIVLIALWAATSQAMTDGINANWGLGTTGIVAAMFIAFAFAPLIELPTTAAEGLKRFSERLSPVGDLFSWLDGVMAVPFACAQGANLDRWWERYLILALAIVPSGALGYWLPAPFGLIAIGWGFAVTIAISRRWAWVEDDRELAMLTRNFSSSALRVGFKQDLRDEALLSFLSMFIYVPLALRQADMWAVQTGTDLFTLTEGTPNDLQTWMAFYGSELAKAVPFVDWAETYSVEGQTNVEFKDSIWAKHLVFMTRILVDLVFLGALLQAIAISGRISKQREMFFGKDRRKNLYRHGNPKGLHGDLNMLDPFIEAKEFRKLRGPGGEIDQEKIRHFPTYDPARLLALTNDADRDLSRVARALRGHQLSNNPDVLDSLYQTLDETVAAKGRLDKDRVKEVVAAVKEAGGSRNVLSLRAARGALNEKPWATYVRRDIMEMIAKADPEITDNPEVAKTERIEALVWCLVGDLTGGPAENPEERKRDAHRDVRDVALKALMQMPSERHALEAIEVCADSDPAEALRRSAQDFLETARTAARSD